MRRFGLRCEAESGRGFPIRGQGLGIRCAECARRVCGVLPSYTFRSRCLLNFASAAATECCRSDARPAFCPFALCRYANNDTHAFESDEQKAADELFDGGADLPIIGAGTNPEYPA